MYSFITTSYNDCEGLRILMNSLFQSSILPNEIIILDSESTDGTKEYVMSLSVQESVKIIYVNKKMTIGTARNYGVSLAKNDFVLVSDTYCILAQNWAEKMIENLQKGFAFVGGRFHVIGDKCAQKGYAKLVNNNISKFNPSSRSIAFKKEDFIELGGYPRDYNQGEDTKFNLNIIASGKKYRQEPEAIVEWYGRESLRALFKQYKRYTIGDCQYKIIKKRHIIIPFVHPVVNLCFLGLPFLLYLTITFLKLTLNKRLSTCSLLVRFTIDFGSVAGVNNFLLAKLNKI